MLDGKEEIDINFIFCLFAKNMSIKEFKKYFVAI